MPLWLLLSSSPVTAGGLAPPVANPDGPFSVNLGGGLVTLNILSNDNLRGELPSDVHFTFFDTELEGSIDGVDPDNKIIYRPPDTGGPRMTTFAYIVIGTGGASNGGVPTPVTIQLTLPGTSTVYEFGIYEAGIYE